MKRADPLFDTTERTPREAVIAMIADMLKDERGSGFIETAVTAFAMTLVARAKRRPPRTKEGKEDLSFAWLILEDYDGGTS
jgi:hypothetical protein